MINPQKVRAMSRIANYEHGRGREALRVKKYSEDMPVWKSMARSALAGILLYVLILAIVYLLMPDELLDLRQKLGNSQLIIIAAGGMAFCAAGYSIISDAVFRRRYRKLRSTMCGYKADNKFLEKIRREQGTNESTG